MKHILYSVKHALRAFTANDRNDIKRTAENYPVSAFYKTDEILTSLGTGEALITALNEKGIPTPLAATCMRAPMTRMDVLTGEEIRALVIKSDLVRIYERTIDSETAYEILKEKIDVSQKEEHQKKLQEENSKVRRGREQESVIKQMSKNTMVRQVGRTVVRELARGLLGALGVSTTIRRSGR